MPKAKTIQSAKKSSHPSQKSVALVPKPVKTTTKKAVSQKLVLPIFSPKGEKIGTMSVPKDLFGVPFHSQLVAQALRIFQMNQRQGSAATKTRGEVEGSTRKIYRQKGTGRARHGGVRAPIFVGGGVAHGPQPRRIHKILTKQMKKKALASALSYVANQNALRVVDGVLELPLKTKAFAEMLHNIKASKRTLFVYGEESKSIVRALRNIQGASTVPFHSLHTFDVMTHGSVIFSKDALASFVALQHEKI